MRKEVWGKPGQIDPCSSCSPSSPQSIAPGRLRASVRLSSSTLQHWEVKAPRGWEGDGSSYTLNPPRSNSSYRSIAVSLPCAWPTGRAI